MSSPSPKPLAAVAVAMLCFLKPESVFADVVDSTQAIVATPRVDERLYLVRCVEQLYEGWSAVIADPVDFETTVAELRGRALQLRQHVRDERLDESLEAMFDDFLGSLDAYLRFLERVDAINADTTIRASEDAFKSGFKGGFAGGTAYNGLQRGDATSGDAVAAALLIGVATTAFDAWRQAEARDQAKSEAIAAEARRADDQLRTALYRAQSLSRSLARKYGWETSEVGFELDAGRLDRIRVMAARGDYDALLHLTRDEARRRPRDPWAQFAADMFAMITSVNAEPSPDAALSIAAASVRHAALVPAHSVFDADRSALFHTGAQFALKARLLELDAGEGIAIPTVASGEAVRLFELALSNDPADSTGAIRGGLAQAFFYEGRAADARRIASSIAAICGDSPEFCYAFACILTANGDRPTAMSWLTAAVARGWPDIAGMRSDPNLELLRQTESTRFKDLTETRWSWSIKWGVFNDDLQVTNTSSFALTNVTFAYDLRQDVRTWIGELKADRIEPRATHVWPNVISVPDRRLTWRSAVLGCDQNVPAAEVARVDSVGAPGRAAAGGAKPDDSASPPPEPAVPQGDDPGLRSATTPAVFPQESTGQGASAVANGRRIHVSAFWQAVARGENVARVREGEEYAVHGESECCYLIDVNGNKGWVAKEHVSAPSRIRGPDRTRFVVGRPAVSGEGKTDRTSGAATALTPNGRTTGLHESAAMPAHVRGMMPLRQGDRLQWWHGPAVVLILGLGRALSRILGAVPEKRV